jgi:signal transduction histidine kinase
MDDELTAPLHAQQRATADDAVQHQARLEILARSSEAFAAARLDYQTVLDTVARLVSELMGDACDVRLLSPDGGWLQTVALYHADPDRRAGLRAFYRAPGPVGQGVSGRVLRTGQPVLLPSLSSPEAVALLSPQGRQYLQRFGMHSLLAVPLRGREGVLGVLATSRDTPGHPYTADDQTLLQDLADRAALAIENARLYQAEQQARQSAEQAAERSARLQEITAALVEATTIEQVSQVIVGQAVPAFRADAGAVVLVAPDGQTCHTVAAAGYDAATLEGWRAFPLAAPAPVADAIRRQQPVFVPTLDHLAADYPQVAASLTNSPSRAWAAIPLMLPSRAMGALTLSFRVPQVFARLDRDFLLTVAGQCALALGRARLFTELEARVRERTLALESTGQQLQALSARLQVLREEERTHIAREIHDELGQQLTSLKIDVTQLNKAIDRDDRAALAARTQALAALLDTMIQTVRRIATDLRPAVLDDFGLLAAIEWQVQEFQSRSGIACRFSSNVPELKLEAPVATALFRMFQEALTNIARHAQATHVEAVLAVEGARLTLEVSDNGLGITDRQRLGTGSLGLVGMRERVRQIGGEFQIQSAPGQGTTITVRVPIAQEQHGSA